MERFDNLFGMMVNQYPNYHIFPISKFTVIEHLCICPVCYKIYIDREDSKDYGICSVDCGMKYRGISWSDFL